MVDPRTRTGVACDFCSERPAVLYCRADSAKLCLFCDQHVHSANLLSRKHTRSQICDNCRSEPVSVRCSTDNIVLCQECDWDAHGSCPASTSHDRDPIEGFSGCPSALELAALCGLDLEEKNEPSRSGRNKNPSVHSVVFGFHDLMVPNENSPMMFSDMSSGDILNASKRQSASCGRYKQVIHEQLLELFKQDVVGGAGGGSDTGGGGGGGSGENMVPGTPTRNAWEENPDRISEGCNSIGAGTGTRNATVGPVPPPASLEQKGTFTSLLIPGSEDLKENAEGDSLWENNPSGTVQIWDFNSGRLRDRDREEPALLEVGYVANNAGFDMKSYGSSFTSANVVEDMYQFSCSLGHEDTTPFNVSVLIPK